MRKSGFEHPLIRYLPEQPPVDQINSSTFLFMSLILELLAC